ncbi:MAG: SpoIIE family protein phosphatase [Brevinematales bacterium]|nr:SpoIIE family protein phosphatase [Brevinematales bacterium]
MKRGWFLWLWWVGIGAVLYAGGGTLDISQTDWQRGRTVRLSGEWLFYPFQLLDPATTRWEDHESLIIKVPDSWHRYSWKGKPLPAYGYGTYRLVIFSTDEPLLLGLRVPFLTSAYSLYINGKHMLSEGKVGTNRESYIPHMVPRYVTFSNSAILELVVQIANFYDNKGGMYNTIELGLWDTIHARRNLNIAIDIFLVGALFIMAVYHLALFTLQRKEKGILYFSLLALTLAIRTLINHECLFHLYIYDLSWRTSIRMDFVLVNLITIWVVAFMRTVFSSSWYSRLLKYAIGFYGVLTVIDLVFPEEVYFHTQMVYIWVTVPLGFSLLVALVREVFRHNAEAGLLLMGFSAFFLTALNDIFYAIQKFNVFEIYLTPFGQLVFIFFQAFVLSRRFSVAYQTSERLKHNLEEEVKRQTIELLSEKNKLLQKNHMIQEELELARQIQLQFIPSIPPAHNFAFYFHPMIQVGGDFFDIHQIDTHKWGIFISDVSGHGVPAAFITSLIKSYLLQTPHVHDPENLLYGLNDFLFPYLAGNFVTSLYLVYDEDQATLLYANAGHLDPLLIMSSGSISALPCLKRGVPLGILSREELFLMDKGYKNHTYKFEEGRLLLFTDGLIEAISQRLHVPFEEILWGLPWKDLSSLSATEIVMAIVDNFKTHIQLENVMDDICLLCIEPVGSSLVSSSFSEVVR